MLKDQVDKKRTRGPSGRWTPVKMMHRMDAMLEAIALGEEKVFQVVGLTELATEYTGFCRARTRLMEKMLEDGKFNAPTVSFETATEDEQALPSSQWQLWYRDPDMRRAKERTAFLLKIVPGSRALRAREMIRDPDTGKLVPAKEVTPAAATDREGFDEQWSYEENLASYRRQLLKRFRREDKEELYVAMRADPATFEPYWKDLAAAGLDYKETLEEYYAKQRAAVAPTAAAPAAAPSPRVQGVMTLQELRRILDGYGELPPPGAEDLDPGWQAFEARFLAANGQEAKRPLRAALEIVRREASTSPSA